MFLFGADGDVEDGVEGQDVVVDGCSTSCCLLLSVSDDSSLADFVQLSRLLDTLGEEADNSTEGGKELSAAFAEVGILQVAADANCDGGHDAARLVCSLVRTFPSFP